MCNTDSDPEVNQTSYLGWSPAVQQLADLFVERKRHELVWGANTVPVA
jgi:hypothetical protein